MKKTFWLLLSHLISVAVVNAQKSESKVLVNAWLTTSEGSKRLEKQPDLYFQIDSSSLKNTDVVFVDDQIAYQEMDGFGAAMTGTSAFVLNRYLNPTQRDSLMTELFSQEGIHLSFVRQMIGASGYEIGGDYSYDDMPAGKIDTGLNNFSIEKDKPDVIPMLRMAIAKNNFLKIFGSPCSAPGWMKNTGSMRGAGNSFLLPRYYSVYARYFVKYIHAYAKEGIPIFAVTIQNEPEFGPVTYPGMIMSAKEQLDFIKNHIGPAFAREKINTKLIVFDHNWAPQSIAEKGFNYPLEILDDSLARRYVAGSGFHNYGGDASLQSFVHDKHPDKDIWFTEGSGGEWVGGFKETMKAFVSSVIIGTVRNWSKGICLWNLALDKENMLQKTKKTADQNCVACYGLVMIDSSGNITRMPEYYALAHASKFVASGAQRIASNSFPDSIENVAFKNPDGSKILLAINNGKATATFKVTWGGSSFRYTLAQGDVVTLVWN
jgi:glucosylceramidase